jgi:xylose isomerase
MDAYARALLIADRIISDGRLQELKAARYISFDSGDGKRFENGELSLADLRNIAASGPEPTPQSGKQELVENLINDFMFS